MTRIRRVHEINQNFAFFAGQAEVIPQGTERTAVCPPLTQNDQKLKVNTDKFFQNLDRYYKEPMKTPVDRKKLEQLYNSYKGELNAES